MFRNKKKKKEQTGYGKRYRRKKINTFKVIETIFRLSTRNKKCKFFYVYFKTFPRRCRRIEIYLITVACIIRKIILYKAKIEKDIRVEK